MLPARVLCYGKDEPLPEQIALRAGPLSLMYEHGDLRYIRLGEREIVRRVYVAVRDRNWGTVPAELSEVQVMVSDQSFRIRYSAANQQNEIDFRWRCEIIGADDGTIRFRIDGSAYSTFQRNRIGLCVLLPIKECAGVRAQIERVDGSVVEGVFPLLVAPQSIVGGRIEPHHPFSEMRAIVQEVAPGVRAEIRLEGETFELEDQRNWIDSSYKIYGTPLRLPFPVEITSGTQLAQSLRLSIHDGSGAVPSPGQPSATAAVSFAIGATSAGGRLPRIGLGLASHGQPLTVRDLERLKLLKLAHLRVELRLDQPGYVDLLWRAAGEARALNVGLEAALQLTDAAEDQLRALRAQLDELRPAILAWLVFHVGEPVTSERSITLARQHLREYDTTTLFGGGTNSYFADLNRARPPAEALDIVCYSINPQVHAFDNASLAEACAGIAATVQTAADFAAGKPIAVTPITLKPRFNPVATGPQPELAAGELPPEVDPRQMSLFGAAWTLASLRYLSESGAASATFYETTGWRGVIELPGGSPLPERFRSIAGAVFPLYHVLADAGEFAGAQVIATSTSDPLRLDGLALRRDGLLRVLVASLSARSQPVLVRGLGAQARVRIMDETNAEAAMRWPERFRAQAAAPIATNGGTLALELRPYALVLIDTV